MGRRSPRRAAEAIRAVQRSVTPLTPLARAQTHWEAIVGEAIAAAATPVAERRGELVIRCESSVWAQELDLMAPSILARLRAELGEDQIKSLRFEVK